MAHGLVGIKLLECLYDGFTSCGLGPSLSHGVNSVNSVNSVPQQWLTADSEAAISDGKKALSLLCMNPSAH